jgi:hypothetical protein
MFPWLQTGLFVALIASVAGEPTVIVGDTRITALSPTLLRIEVSRLRHDPPQYHDIMHPEHFHRVHLTEQHHALLSLAWGMC